MPLYDLVCDCGYTKEQILKLKEIEPVCDRCGKRMKRAMSAPVFVLKGSGWAFDSYGLKDNKNKKGDKNG